jgi:cytoskeletal protein CcmA (bactofilin family)
MSWTKKLPVFVVLPTLIFSLLPNLSFASVFSGKDRYKVAAQDTIDDDIYLATGEGLFDGVVTGDVIIASNKYIVSGEIMGNVNSGSQYATIRGTIGKSARIFARTIIIDGTIGNNLLAAAEDIEISESCRIGKDATLFGDAISIAGTIDRDLAVECGRIIISGKIDGCLCITADKISIVEPAEITGNISYKCPKEIRIEDDVIVRGNIEWKKVEQDVGDDDGLNWVLRFLLFLASLVTGLFIIGLTGRHSRLAVDYIAQKPVVCLGVGFVAFCLAPVAIVVLMALIIGIPTAIILLFIYTVFFYISKVYVAIALGRFGIRAIRKGHEPKAGWSLLLGLIILTFLFVIPVLGWFVYFAVIFWGIGAIIMGIRACRWGQQPNDIAASNAAPPPVT